MECRRVCHVNGAAGHCRLVEGIPLLQLGEDVNASHLAFVQNGDKSVHNRHYYLSHLAIVDGLSKLRRIALLR